LLGHAARRASRLGLASPRSGAVASGSRGAVGALAVGPLGVSARRRRGSTSAPTSMPAAGPAARPARIGGVVVVRRVARSAPAARVT
jgi:hypothetical protein